MSEPVTIKLNDVEFKKELDRHLSQTSRALQDAINSRMYYFLCRWFIILPPRYPQLQRNKVRLALAIPKERRGRIKKDGTFKRHGRLRQLQSAHLILQKYRGKMGLKGLYGKAMREAVGKFRRYKINKVGYLKSLIVRALRLQTGKGFVQFGGKINGKQVNANPVLVKLASQYNHEQASVGVANGPNVSVSSTQAKAGFDPKAVTRLQWAVKGNQTGKVTAMLTETGQKALDDETKEMRKHMEEVVSRLNQTTK